MSLRLKFLQGLDGSTDLAGIESRLAEIEAFPNRPRTKSNGKPESFASGRASGP
jgi:hypothetical protein